MTVDRKLRVGVLLSLKKWSKHAFAHSSRVEFSHLQPADITAAHLSSLQLDCLLHKVGDFLLEPAQLAFIREEVTRWGGPVIDDFDRVQLLSDRRLICSLLLHLERHCREGERREGMNEQDNVIRLPSTVGTLVDQDCWCPGMGDKLKDQNLSTNCVPTVPPQISPISSLSSSLPLVSPPTLCFPAIRKPVAACSVEDSHLMCIIHSPDQLVGPLDEFILQELIPHGGILYKVYAIGEEQRIQVRPSLPSHWLEPAPQARPFDSQSLKRLGTVVNASEAMARLTPRHLEHITQYTAMLRSHLGLTLFGWDLIVGEGDGRLYVIDLNYFPGYDEVEFLGLLTDCLEQRLSHEGKGVYRGNDTL